MPHIHQRSFSNSVRVHITSASPVKASHKDNGAAHGESFAFDGSRRFANGPPSPSGLNSIFIGRGGKLRRGRLALALLLGIIVYVVWSRALGPQSPWIVLDDDTLGPPPVAKEVLNRLRALEDLLGGPDHGDGDVRGRTMEYREPTVVSPSTPGPDDLEVGYPPTVVAIPEPLRYPKLPMPPPPPAVTQVPAAELDSVVCPAQAEQGLPCAFIVPAFVGEQETKAQQHLHQLGLLALHLNRTLVLPNVSRSRMGTCYSYAFDLYYAPDSLARLGVPTIPYATFVKWSLDRDPMPTAQLISVMPGKASYPAGAIEVDPLSDDGILPHKPDRNLCLDKGRTRLDFARYSPITIWGPEKWHQSEQGRLGYGEGVVRTLQGPEALQSSWRASPPTPKDTVATEQDFDPADALVINYELRHPILHPEDVPSTSALSSPSGPILLPFEHFPYAATWLRLATFLSSQLKPYVAVHWRQETLDPERLAPCAAKLLEKLADVKAANPDVDLFYLATDYPLEDLESGREGTVAHSGTFAKLLTPTHHSAMRRFLKDLTTQVDAGVGPRLTTFAREQERLVRKLPKDLAAELAAALPRPLPPSGVQVAPGTITGSELTSTSIEAALKDLDPGLWGIVDKIVSMSAQYFLSGRPGVCAKESSFTRQIVEARTSLAASQQEAVEMGPSEGYLAQTVRIRSVVEYWGTPESDEHSD